MAQEAERLGVRSLVVMGDASNPATIDRMRARAQEDVLAAIQRIDAEFQTARAQIEREAPVLAGEIVRTILEKPFSVGGGAAR